MDRGDFFDSIGTPAVRVLAGTISRVTSGSVFVIIPGYDSGQEFGPVVYSGPTPTASARCVVAVVTETGEAWIVEWEGALATVPNPLILAKAVNTGAQTAPSAATWTQIQFSALTINQGVWTTTGSPIIGIIVPTAGTYRVTGQIATVANSQTFLGALTYNRTTTGTGHTFPDGTSSEAYTGATDSNGTGYPMLFMETICDLAAGAILGMEWYQTTAGPQGGVAGKNHLTAERLR